VCSLPSGPCGSGGREFGSICSALFVYKLLQLASVKDRFTDLTGKLRATWVSKYKEILSNQNLVSGVAYYKLNLSKSWISVFTGLLDQKETFTSFIDS